ncbi:peptidylprolyl isomerase, partial [Porticoccaceae bacterium]|nr:peptidylprolyl isomerase [Porticoccaceae bacterium]
MRENVETASNEIDSFQDVVIKTSIGSIFIKVYVNRAPITAKNFLALVDAKVYTRGCFYRAVNTEHHMPGDMQLLQGGILPRQSPFPSIEHETTVETGIAHDIGVVSMARRAPGTASTEFFICLANMPILDYSGCVSNGEFDGYGYASFGRVGAGL